MDLGLSGLASGLDWRSLIAQLSEVERQPQKRLLSEQNTLELRRNAYGSILTQLGVLRTRVTALKSPDLFESRIATSSDTSAATASVSAGAVQGSYQFQFQQLATSARQLGQAGAGRPLNATSEVSGLLVSSAGFASPVTAGTFRVNGAAVTLDGAETLQQVFDKIRTATGDAVTASYDPATDKIRLVGSGPIVLGSATDTSNFLQVARLNNNGTSTITSASELGAVRLGATLAEANFTTALAYGPSGSGTFKINGVSFQYESTDRLDTLLARINASAAGVIASYDSQQDRFVLANKATGDVGIALEDVEGNFLAATRLSSGTLERGKDLLYTINGGGQLRSQSNTLTAASSGLTGLTVTALKEGGTATVSVGSDKESIKKAINDFLTEFNRVQSTIASSTASTTDAKGKVEASILATEGDADAISASLRRLAYGAVSGLEGTLRHLEALGIKSSGDNDTLTLADGARLEEALTNRLPEVKDLFTHATLGIAVGLDRYLEKTAGEDGTLVAKQGLLTRQASDIDLQIADMERIVQANAERMKDSFVAMEQAQYNINQQLQYLLRRFPAAS